MSAVATIEKGSKVRVTFEGTYDSTTALGRMIVKAADADGGEGVAPAGAQVDVIAPPLPEEPGVGAMVKVNYANAIYKRNRSGWWKMTSAPEQTASGSTKYHTWEQINSEWGRGELAKLGVDGSQHAKDMKEKPYRVAGGYGVFNGDMTAQIVGYELVFKLPCGDSVKIQDYDARNLAFSVLKATGGL